MVFRLTDPLVEISDTGAVRSGRYDDIYFQAQDASRESQVVFVQGCNLPARWSEAPHYTIAETGFGFGVNFLQTWRQWRQHRGRCQRLHFVSVEAHPLPVSTLAKMHQRWPEFHSLSRQLLDRFPARTPGYHRINLTDQVTLTLLLGDVQDMLEQLEANVDAWYLDGFAPSKNPQMWQPEVCRQIARLSRVGAALATFSTAQIVREGLTEAGFALTKTSGFGNKRECLSGIFEGQSKSACPGWFLPPAGRSNRYTADQATHKSLSRITIVGAGVAGQSIASALSQRNVPCEVLSAGAASSGNPSVSVMPRLEAGDAPAGQFFWHAYRFALEHWNKRCEFDPCGALQVARTNKEATRYARIVEHWGMEEHHLKLVPDNQLATVTGLRSTVGHAGLWFPEAGIIRGFAPGNIAHTQVKSIAPLNDGWRLRTNLGEKRAETLILAAGSGTLDIDLSCGLGIPFQNWHGEAVQLPAGAHSVDLRCGLFGGRYLHPPYAGKHWAGASFQKTQYPEARAELVDAVLHQFPEMKLNPAALSSWTGWRQATPDRLPVAGPVLDMSLARDRLAWVRGGPPGSNAPWQPGLHVLGGLGARGFTTAPLLGEWLASMLCDDPWPMPRNLALAVCSSRFVVRDLRRSSAD